MDLDDFLAEHYPKNATLRGYTKTATSYEDLLEELLASEELPSYETLNKIMNPNASASANGTPPNQAATNTAAKPPVPTPTLQTSSNPLDRTKGARSGSLSNSAPVAQQNVPSKQPITTSLSSGNRPVATSYSSKSVLNSKPTLSIPPRPTKSTSPVPPPNTDSFGPNEALPPQPTSGKLLKSNGAASTDALPSSRNQSATQANFPNSNSNYQNSSSTFSSVTNSSQFSRSSITSGSKYGSSTSYSGLPQVDNPFVADAKKNLKTSAEEDIQRSPSYKNVASKFLTGAPGNVAPNPSPPSSNLPRAVAEGNSPLKRTKSKMRIPLSIDAYESPSNQVPIGNRERSNSDPKEETYSPKLKHQNQKYAESPGILQTKNINHTQPTGRTQPQTISHAGYSTSVDRAPLLSHSTPGDDGRKPTDGLPRLFVSITLVDQSQTFKFMVTADYTIQELSYAFTQRINLWQTDYFNLAKIDSNGVETWLHPLRTLEEQNVTAASNLVYKVKFFKKAKKLVDPNAVHLWYIEVKHLITSGKLPCSIANSIQFAALSLQNERGDFSPDTQNYFSEETVSVLIPPSMKTIPFPYLQWRILSHYSRLKGTKAIEAKTRYLEMAASLPLHGLSMFPVAEGGATRMVGVAEDGLFVSQGWSLVSKKDYKDSYTYFKFDEIANWTLTARGVSFRFRDEKKNPPLDFTTPNNLNIAELLTDYYTLLNSESGGKLLKIPSAVSSSFLPDYRLFYPPQPRKLVDPNISRLEFFKLAYFEECKSAGVVPVLKLVQQIEHYEEMNSDLQALELNGCGMNHLQLDAFAKAFLRVAKYQPTPNQEFNENMNIFSLDLSNNPIGPDGVPALGEILQSSVAIKTLLIGNIQLGVKGARALGPFLEANKVIDTINIQENDLTGAGATAILAGIRRNKNYAFINLAKNQLDSKFVKDVRDFFLSHTSLKGISLSSNKLGEAGMITFTTALWEIHSIAALELLELNDVGMGSEVKKILNWVSKTPSLKSLNIGFNPMPEAAGLRLAQYLSESTNNLTKLDIKMCDINKKTMEEICKSLGRNEKLEVLSLSGNPIKKKAGTALAASLEVNKALRSLSLRSCSLSKKVFIVILAALQKHPIKRLDLSYNKEAGSSDVATEIGRIISVQGNLEHLDLSQCEISHVGITLISAGIFRSTSLKSILLDGNKIAKDASKIAEAVRSLTCKLEDISMRNAGIHEPDAAAFFEALGSTCKLTNLNLEGNGLEVLRFRDRLKKYPELNVTF
eukprot:TRINITY_DN3378_c0_g1_i4.p1 TRINITY_DN3378_c0_g1~~TRINITY_DN3378_c0_g1_i4.p1  ORF type:complete len:1255 (-),score=352.83 TRINITY_DN3378_c0_g1_i4:20-3784(-)